MTRGLNRRQIGLTEAMVQAYGDTVWDLSHNIQLRIGDPARRLDWNAIEAQRPGTGMSDGQIAERIGLSRDQVTHIRLLLEHRRFRRENYHRLLGLGGGRRFRAERYSGPERQRPLGEAAMALRAALDFDPRDAARYLHSGLWRAATPAGLLRRAAETRGEGLAAAAPDRRIGYAELLDRAERGAARLRDRGLEEGAVVPMEAAGAVSAMVACCTASVAGAVLLPLSSALDAARQREWCERLSAADRFDALVEGWERADRGGPGDRPPLASAPLAVLLDDWTARAVVHNAHTLLAGLDLIAAGYGLSAKDRLAVAGADDGAMGLAAAMLALVAGAAVTSAAEATVIFTRDAASVPERAAPRLVVAAGGDASAIEAGLGGGGACRARICGEGLIVLTGTPDAPRALRHETEGRPNPAMEARVVSGAGDVLGAGEEGALELRGANLAPSYLGDEKANRTAFTGDRWLRTGLAAVIRSDGAVALRAGGASA